MNRNLPAFPRSGLAQSPSAFEGAFDNIMEAVDEFAPGVRGRLIHEYLMRQEYFEDPAAAQDIYQRRPAVDQYLDNITISRASEGGEASGLTGAQIAAATMGFGFGLATAYFVSSLASATGP